jgi:subtilisin family serine protease
MLRSSLPTVFLALLHLAFAALGSGAPAAVAAEDSVPEHSREWILIQLDEGLDPELVGNETLAPTGSDELDAALRALGIRGFEFAVPRALATASPSGLERLRRYGLERTYRALLPSGGDAIDAAATLGALPGVAFAEPDWVGRGDALPREIPDDPRLDEQWALDADTDADIDAPEAWAISTGSDETIVAVLDTGLDVSHPDLASKIWINPGEDLDEDGELLDDDDLDGSDNDGNLFPDDLWGWDWVNEDNEPLDDSGHGSLVGSMIGAATNNAEGIAGVCWNCRLMSLKVLDENVVGLYSWWVDGILYAIENGADVINLSASGELPSSLLEAGVGIAYDAGVPLICSTGNTNSSLPRYPAGYPETIAVGASDELDRRAFPLCVTGGSAFGDHLDLIAPGADVLGAVPEDESPELYETVCGTSYGAAHVSGVAGLAVTLNGALAREELRDILHAGADDQVGFPTEDTPGFDIYHGWGRLNAVNTASAARALGTLVVEGQDDTRIRLTETITNAVEYDIARGNVADLSRNDESVDLGTLECILEDGSTPDTGSGGDTDRPEPGHSFFYVARYSSDSKQAVSWGGSDDRRDRSRFRRGCFP